MDESLPEKITMQLGEKVVEDDLSRLTRKPTKCTFRYFEIIAIENQRTIRAWKLLSDWARERITRARAVWLKNGDQFQKAEAVSFLPIFEGRESVE